MDMDRLADLLSPGLNTQRYNLEKAVEWLKSLDQTIRQFKTEDSNLAKHFEKRLYLYDCWCQEKGVTPTQEDLETMEKRYWPFSRGH